MKCDSSKDIYNLPLYYDIAFDFRNVPKQADFLEQIFEKHSGRQMKSIIELGCGPGYFVREFAARGKKSVGLDLFPEMIEYTKEKLYSLELSADLIIADMIDFTISKPVDMAILMMDSISHILTKEEFLKHLRSVAENLTERGIYFLECSHPAGILQNIKKTGNEWTSERDGIIVEIRWGRPSDLLDPLTQITPTTVTMKINRDNKEFEIKEIMDQKSYLTQELLALIELSGKFDLAASYGDFDLLKPFDNSSESWRMNIVLRKK